MCDWFIIIILLSYFKSIHIEDVEMAKMVEAQGLEFDPNKTNLLIDTYDWMTSKTNLLHLFLSAIPIPDPNETKNSPPNPLKCDQDLTL